MEKTKYFLDMIGGFISGTLLWPVVVLIIFWGCRKPIIKLLENLGFIEITKDGSIIKIGFKFVEYYIARKEVQKRQTIPYKTGISEENDPLKLEIIRIYSEIETAVKNKFGVTDIFSLFASFYEKGKVDSDTLIILSSMELLRDEILSSTASPKITRKYIDNYSSNAKRIIKIIQEIEN